MRNSALRRGREHLQLVREDGTYPHLVTAEDLRRRAAEPPSFVARTNRRAWRWAEIDEPLDRFAAEHGTALQPRGRPRADRRGQEHSAGHPLWMEGHLGVGKPARRDGVSLRWQREGGDTGYELAISQNP